MITSIIHALLLTAAFAAVFAEDGNTLITPVYMFIYTEKYVYVFETYTISVYSKMLG